ncbi:hypothetical protein [Rasiella sp. SM2506]|uniref:hypothetical protein n=1 Tax=Rasiella sp. SM2506 TaxID=3423914 RepID=UPI003D79B433
MKLSIVLFGLWLFCVQHVWGQKELSRTYFAEGIENISIDANGVHSLNVVAAKVEEISVSVHLEGETSEEIVIKEQLENNQLALGFSSWPLAKTYNDKLSAHKIISVAVTLSIPEHLFVSITSNTTAVFAEGTFKSLSVDIEDEICVLQDFNGDATLKTNRGTILVLVQNKSTSAKATTTYGTLENTLSKYGIFTIYAESVHGNISLQQTQ